ncbi:MAG: phosphotransferase [Kofleriaceae bacterium]
MPRPSPTTESSLRAGLAKYYGLTAPTIERRDRVSGDASELYRIDEDGRTRWLKLASHQDRSLAALEAEAATVAALADRGLSVAPPIRRRGGRYAGKIVRTRGVLWRHAGDDERVTPGRLSALGALVAVLHASKVRARVPALDDDARVHAPLRWLATLARPERTRLREISSEMFERTSGQRLRTGLCHGDLHLGNVRFTAGEPILFDFEGCGRGPCAYDLACFWRKHVVDAGAPGRKTWSAFLRGYATVRAPTHAELSVIPAFATLRAIWTFALPNHPAMEWGRGWLRDHDYVSYHLSIIERYAALAVDV